MRSHGKIYTKKDVPNHFDERAIATLNRINANHSVKGLLFIRNGVPELNTLPETMAQTISTRLPAFNKSVMQAINEVDVLDKLVAFRIETRKYEILVAAENEFAACVLHDVNKRQKKIFAANDRIMKIMQNLLKDKRDEWLVETTATINKVNPMVDRIMNDESVGGVIMTNKEGAPILTNTNLMTATHYGSALQRLGALTRTYIKDMNPFDEVLVLRVNTKKLEMIIAPHAEFTIIVIQQPTYKSIHKKK